MNAAVVLALILFGTHGELSDAATTRIVGGHEAPLDYGRYHVSLQNLTGHHVCGGAAVSRFHVVTSAHCVLGAEPQYIKASVGTTNLDFGGQQYNVISIKIHEKYNTTSRENDIAIITVEKPFDLKCVEILKLYDNELMNGDEVTLTGFGAEKPNGESSRIMHLLILPVFLLEICRFAMRYNREVFDSMFCTFTRIGEGTCHGDSGGPVVINNQLAGLVSWGIPCAMGFPDVHTRIKPYLNWINKYIYLVKC
uniref:Trypsin-like proteinase n=1 Tax=Chilo suppressalis TaxID=168631 RepID=I3UII4_CHISP|nr:trypsin-like proteinase [Chilo suppressalis]